MIFPNVRRYRLDDGFTVDEATLAQALNSKQLSHPGKLETVRMGFSSPFGDGSEALVMAIEHYLVGQFASAERMLPNDVVREAISTRAQAIAAKTGQTPGKRQLANLRDEVLVELLPQAFVRTKATAFWFDLERMEFYTASVVDARCELLAKTLRGVLGSLPLAGFGNDAQVRSRWGKWLVEEACESGFSLGDEIELKDERDTRSVTRCRRQDLSANEIKAHLTAGKVPTQLGLRFDDRLDLVLSDKLDMRKIKATELLEESDAQQSAGDDVTALVADFLLQANELARLSATLDTLFVDGD